MPRGGKRTNHKGRNRRFTNPETLEEERRREAEKNRSKNRSRVYREENDSTDEDEGGDGKSVPSSGSEESESNSEGLESNSDDESGSETESDIESKGKGVEKLIEIQNPNRVQKKTHKLSSLNDTLQSSSQPELSRREKEELKKQAARARYQKLHAKGLTREARADLARLAIIKAQREEAAMKRKMEKIEKEEQLKSKQEAIGKAIGKKT